MESLVTWYRGGGGPLMVPLLLIGVLGVVVLLERLRHTVIRSRIIARPFMERVISLTRAGKAEEALSLCAEHESILPDLGLVLLRSRSDDEHALRAIAEAATASVIPSMSRRLRWLPALAQLAAFLGALGGIMNLHDALASGGSWSSAATFALRPVGAGLLDAIPLVVGHTYLRGRMHATLEQMAEFSARLINALVGRPDVRLGHRN